MECPHCHTEIPETAVRCKHCRHPVRESAKAYPLGDFYKTAVARAVSFLLTGRNPAASPWSFLDVLVIGILIVIFIFSDPFRPGAHIIRFLRLHFFIFTKEPKLLHYVSIYINTAILKAVSLVFLIIFVRLRRVSFWDSVVFSGKMPDYRGMWLPLYLVACVIIQLVNMLNPLVPNIPFNSVFIEALFVGNLIVILSVLFIAPFIEEILFRGFLYPALNRYMGIYPSIILTALLFSLAHYPQVKDDFVFMAAVFTLGLIITYARAITGSTWLAIRMHYLYNLVAVVMGFISYFINTY